MESHSTILLRRLSLLAAGRRSGGFLAFGHEDYSKIGQSKTGLCSITGTDPFDDRLDLFAQKDRQGRWNRTWHNALRQPVLTADALGQSIRYEWCKCGALQKLIDAKGQMTSWKYDAQARNTEKTYADGRKEISAYEPLSGRLVSSTDAKGQIKSFTYNLDHSVKTYTYSNATIPTPGVSFTYDPVYSRLTTMTDGTGLTSYTYKPVGQLGALAPATTDGPLSGQTDLITYTYDALGRGKTRNIGPLGTENLVTLNYDNLGRMTSTINPLGTFGHFYVGATGRTDYINYPNGQKTSLDYFGNTGDNRLQTITHLANGANPASNLSKFDYTYQPDGSIVTWQRQSGSDPATALTLGYDLANQLTSANLAPVATPASITQRYSYQYDKAGNRNSRQVGNEVTSASHNNVNQITGTAGGGKLLVAGNTDEPAKVKVNGKLATVTASPQNLYQAWIDVTPGVNSISIEATDFAPTPNTTTKSWTVSVTGGAARSFTFDTNGNTLSDGLRTYEWDAENRLVKITQGSNVYDFTYDGLSRRIAEKLNGSMTKRWVWIGSRIAEQRDATGSTVQRQYYSHGQKRIGGADAGNYYYTRDHLGNIREMTDSTAAVRARYDYDPYGSRSKLTGDLDCDFGFTGHYYHAGSNLHLTLYRAYDQDLGRWLSEDPIGEEGGINLYGYVGGDPLNQSDPLGLCPLASPETARIWSNTNTGTGDVTATQAVGFMTGAIAANAVVAAGGYYIVAGDVAVVGITRLDLIRTGPTVISNQIVKGAGATGATVVKYCIKGGGGKLPLHFHIHRYNWLKPWTWFKHTPIIKP